MKIELRDIRKSFGSTPVIRGVSLAIEENELFFLLGPSGCGKTTLLRMLAGFASPDSGDLLIEGKRVNDLPPEERRTPMVFQSYALWPHMTVLENVSYGLSLLPMSAQEQRRRAMEALEATRMTDFAERSPNQLSGGQQQRVAISRALAVNPTVLLFDEPLSNLDAKLRVEMRAELLEIHERHPFTAVYVTHDQEEAMTMASRIAVLDQGQLLQTGAPHEIYTRPKTRFVAEFMGPVNWLEGRVKEVDPDRTVTLETSVGLFLARPSSALSFTSVGARVLAGFRPSAASLAATPHANVISCEVVRSQYAGSSQHLVVSVRISNLKFEISGQKPAKPDLAFQVTETNPRRMRKAGEKLEISFAPEDVILLPV